MLLDNSVALVTGGAAGIGKEIVVGLLGKGAKVVIADINIELGTELEKEYGKERLLFVKCDVTVQDELYNAFDSAINTFGKLDIVCNNAGIMSTDPMKSRQMVAINLTAVIEGTYKGVEIMSKNKNGHGGVIINMASAAGLGVFPGISVYPATKAGVVSFTRSFEFLPHMNIDGVRVNCVCPVFVETDMFHNAAKENPHMLNMIEKLGGTVGIGIVVKAVMKCLEDDTLNAAVLMVKPPDHVIQVTIPRPQPIV